MIGTMLIGMMVALVATVTMMNQYLTNSDHRRLSYGGNSSVAKRTPAPIIEPEPMPKPVYGTMIDLRAVGLDELRLLDRAYAGTKRGEVIHDLRKERVMNKRTRSLEFRETRDKFIDDICTRKLDPVTVAQLEKILR